VQAGGIGYGKLEQAKEKTTNRRQIVILGGENYRIGMGVRFLLQIQVLLVGIELNAIQRSNPEMQKTCCQCHSWIGRK
jgi:phosphoribosylformylglycinamidine (FGAM) synthase-like enzyme